MAIHPCWHLRLTITTTNGKQWKNKIQWSLLSLLCEIIMKAGEAFPPQLEIQVSSAAIYCTLYYRLFSAKEIVTISLILSSETWPYFSSTKYRILVFFPLHLTLLSSSMLANYDTVWLLNLLRMSHKQQQSGREMIGNWEVDFGSCEGNMRVEKVEG